MANESGFLYLSMFKQYYNTSFNKYNNIKINPFKKWRQATKSNKKIL